MAEPALLRDLLRERHWQIYRTFCMQYDKAARTVDASYVGTYPSRAQLHRWQSGDLKGLPYPQHCEVLEAMFPGVKAAEMFRPASARAAIESLVDTDVSTERFRDELSSPVGAQIAQPALEDVVRQGLAGEVRDDWPELATARSSTTPGFPLRIENPTGANDGPADAVVRGLRLHGKRLRMAESEIGQLARLSGAVVDFNLDCSIDIGENGWATVEYRFEIFNLTGSPIRRILREQWFETTDGALRIEPSSSGDRKVRIQRTHDTANMSKFACEISPAIAPGEVGVIGYTTSGGRFSHDHYWRQSVPRHTRHFTLTIRHRGVDLLLGATAMEDQVDGSQTSVLDDLTCEDEDGAARMTVTRNHLRPGQAVTLRWEVSRVDSS